MGSLGTTGHPSHSIGPEEPPQPQRKWQNPRGVCSAMPSVAQFSSHPCPGLLPSLCLKEHLGSAPSQVSGLPGVRATPIHYPSDLLQGLLRVSGFIWERVYGKYLVSESPFPGLVQWLKMTGPSLELLCTAFWVDICQHYCPGFVYATMSI